MKKIFVVLFIGHRKRYIVKRNLRLFEIVSELSITNTIYFFNPRIHDYFIIHETTILSNSLNL